jgi:ParB family chromosome partitioning protein
MATRKALGRGLSALIPVPQPAPSPPGPPAVPDLDDAAPPGAPLYIAVARIAPSPNQPRRVFRDADLASLAGSIREQGVLQPLVVRRRGDGYELIIGERRWRAAQLAGLEEVPAVILDASDRQVVEMALVENVQREDLNPVELAQAFRVLFAGEGMTQDEIGQRVGLDRSSVANYLRLMELPEEIQQDLVDDRLSMGHAKAILQVTPTHRVMMRDQIVRGHLSVRASEELSRRIASGEPRSRHGKRRGPRRSPEIDALESDLRRRVQTKVRIVGQPARGRIELYYYGPAELDRLVERLLREAP